MNPVVYPMYSRDHKSTSAPDMVQPINARTSAVTRPYKGRARRNNATAAPTDSRVATMRIAQGPPHTARTGAMR